MLFGGAYCFGVRSWIKRFIIFHNKRDPKEMGVVGVRTTMVYTQVLNAGGLGVHSPLDKL